MWHEVLSLTIDLQHIGLRKTDVAPPDKLQKLISPCSGFVHSSELRIGTSRLTAA